MVMFVIVGPEIGQGEFGSVVKGVYKRHIGRKVEKVYTKSGLPRSGKNVWKMKFFLGQGKVREFCGWPGKFRKDL